MKKTRYYLNIWMPGGIDHDWSDVRYDASKNGMLLYRTDANEIYSYEYDGQEYIRGGWNWPVSLIRTEEVEIEEKVTKLPPDDRYKNGYNWKNAHIRGANSRLRNPDKKSNPYDKLNRGKPPINPKTGRRDGGV